MSDEYASLTEIGKELGVTSHVVGAKLKQLGLRTPDGKPSSPAFNEGFVAQRPSRGIDTYFYVWHRTKVLALLRA